MIENDEDHLSFQGENKCDLGVWLPRAVVKVPKRGWESVMDNLHEAKILTHSNFGDYFSGEILKYDPWKNVTLRGFFSYPDFFDPPTSSTINIISLVRI